MASRHFSPPKGTYIVQAYTKGKWRWGCGSRNWTLQTVWSSYISDRLLPQNSFMPVVRLNAGKQELMEDLRIFLDGAMEEAIEQILDSRSVLLIVGEQEIEDGFNKGLRELKLSAQEGRFSTSPPRTHAESFRFFRAWGGLAEVLLGVLEPSDILIVTGGFGVMENLTGGLCCDLNFNEDEMTNIIRIQRRWGNVLLTEKIEPVKDLDLRFKFTYCAYKYKSLAKKEVVQHRNFSNNTFCTKVTDTLGYSPLRWDFPMPIVRAYDPIYTYKVIMNPKFSMLSRKRYPLLKIPTDSDDLESTKETEDESFNTASASSIQSEEAPSPVMEENLGETVSENSIINRGNKRGKNFTRSARIAAGLDVEDGENKSANCSGSSDCPSELGNTGIGSGESSSSPSPGPSRSSSSNWVRVVLMLFLIFTVFIVLIFLYSSSDESFPRDDCQCIENSSSFYLGAYLKNWLLLFERRVSFWDLVA